MGTSDVIGQIDISPPLDPDEIDLLRAIGTTGRGSRRDGLCAVPRLACPWVPCEDGCCLTLRRAEAAGDPVRWLGFLVEEVFDPGGYELDGMVVGCRGDGPELFAVDVRGNRVAGRVLRQPPASAAPRSAVVVDLERFRDVRG